MVYITKQGETLDIILWRHYKTYPIEQVLTVNPGIAALPKILPDGTKIFLPEIKIENTKQVVRLWS